ncbi:MAG: ABC transporter ATP-binding protein [Deltaproteobacteria bacterium]|nr:ABC transporter ATP-binding protein [Deltaproteobacteria bacterium]MBI3295373.1 ABC transporter ATP-binding protein [Deltaproteobacteria bacterium]
MIAIQLENIGKAFPKTGTVLNAVSLKVEKGAFWSLLGPSGSGKTTLLRILSGLEESDSGTRQLNESGEGDVAFVFQEPALLPWLTVEENIRLPGELLRKPFTSSDVDRVIALVGLGAARGHLPSELSGGMKMRVSLARALATLPQYLFLDEPFAALDEVTRLELEEELSVITKTLGTTTVLVTHSITEAVFLADRVLLLSAHTHQIDREFAIDEPRPRKRTFRAAETYTMVVHEIRERFVTLGSTR